jgi:D-amino-acid dehydrogenase
MKVAVVGAGIIGVTTAWELHRDGHHVEVFERRGSVAAETSFANAGIVAPGYVTPWAAPGMPRKVLGHLWREHAPVRVHARLPLATLRWLWRWWRACDAKRFAAHRSRLFTLARESRDRLHDIARELGIDYERTRGVLVLLREPADARLARASLKLLAELGVPFRLVDAAQCRRVEPGLSVETPLHAGIHLPDDEVGNCPQFAHALRQHAQRGGVRFRMHTRVLGIEPGAPAQLSYRAVDADEVPSRFGGEAATAPAGPVTDTFDAVVVCAAVDSLPLLRPLRLALPMVPVYGYSVTAPLRDFEAWPESLPQSALMDERYKVAISRIGTRVRVAGSAEIGGAADDFDERAVATLYKVLHDWFPGVAQLDQALRWKGARPMLPDRPPIVGATGRPGVWLNVGHGSSGWALACGSARLLAEAIAGREQRAFSLAG